MHPKIAVTARRRAPLEEVKERGSQSGKSAKPDRALKFSCHVIIQRNDDCGAIATSLTRIARLRRAG
jgi:hypothetical protein